jgi:asparagine synthase (glutamine-hydrolysing)
MCSRDGRWLVTYNGELYNHLAVRASLAGPWQSGSDTETLLRLLECEGVEGVARLAGMFAFAAWDCREKTLYLVRDRLGIKPLYYRCSAGGDRVLFASEPGAISAVDPASRYLDTEALGSYLTAGYPPLDRTLFRGIFAVPPGRIVTFQDGQLRSRRYWRLPDACEPGRSDERWAEEFADLWGTVAREHLLSDVPVGLFLSGGLDSSAVAVAVAEHAPALRVFTARFLERGFDESGDASVLARRLGLLPTLLPIDLPSVDEVLPALARSVDLPVCDSSALGTWLLCRAAAQDVKVVLSGDGADEVFAGYPTHRATELLASPFGFIPRVASSLAWRWLPPPPPSGAPVGFGQRATRLLRHARHGPLEAHLRWRSLLDERAVAELVPSLGGDPWAAWEALLPSYPRQAGLNRALALDVEGYLVQDELTRVDRSGMAHGLELRVPFLDHRLVELAFRMPYEVKARRGQGKRPVREWLRRRSCGDVAARRKRGFNHPIAGWLAGGLGDRLLDRAAASPLRPLLQTGVLERWLRRHRRGEEDRAYELWAVLFLLEWADAHDVRL